MNILFSIHYAHQNITPSRWSSSITIGVQTTASYPVSPRAQGPPSLLRYLVTMAMTSRCATASVQWWRERRAQSLPGNGNQGRERHSSRVALCRIGSQIAVSVEEPALSATSCAKSCICKPASAVTRSVQR